MTRQNGRFIAKRQMYADIHPRVVFGEIQGLICGLSIYDNGSAGQKSVFEGSKDGLIYPWRQPEVVSIKNQLHKLVSPNLRFLISNRTNPNAMMQPKTIQKRRVRRNQFFGFSMSITDFETVVW